MIDVQLGGRLKARIGEILLKQGVVTEDELTVGLLLQHGTRKLIGEVLINLQYVTPSDIDHALCQQNHRPNA
jgi:type IV pilus assembly protein PilB